MLLEKLDSMRTWKGCKSKVLGVAELADLILFSFGVARQALVSGGWRLYLRKWEKHMINELLYRQVNSIMSSITCYMLSLDVHYSCLAVHYAC